MRLKKHQRAIVKHLEAAGYTVEVVPNRPHYKLHISKDGKSTRLPMSGSPKNAEYLPEQTLKQVRERIG